MNAVSARALSAVMVYGDHRFAYVTESSVCESGKTVEAALDAMRAVVGPDAELDADNVKPITPRLAAFLAAHGTPKRWAVCGDGGLDLAGTSDAREAAILLFLVRYIQTHPFGIEDGRVLLTFGHRTHDAVDLLFADAAPAYFIELGRGEGTWHEAPIDLDDDVLEQIESVIREVANDAWNADAEQIVARDTAEFEPG